VAKLDVLHQSLNIGVVDKGNLHRTDLERMRLTAETQTNLMATVVGKAFMRPGTEYLSDTKDENECWLFPFIAGVTDSFLLEMTANVLRVRDSDTDILVTRPSVTSTVTSGDFSSATGWTLASASGQTSQVTGGELQLSARAHGAKANCKQQVTTSSASTEHALRIVVTRGPITFRCGSTDGGDEYIAETELKNGEHSLAFTPTGSYWVQFSTIAQVIRKVSSITVESAGVMELPTIWGNSDLPILQIDQSLDVMFLACDGKKQQRIERRGDTSWSVVDYDADDGPFLGTNQSAITMTPAATEGNTTLTASEPFFTSAHVGGLMRVYHEGQKVETYLANDNVYTPTILVTGVNETNYNDREFDVTIAGTWSGTLRTQRSFDGEDIEFHNFRRAQTVSTIDITANASYTNDDNEDNAITYYRLGFEENTYTSGEASVNIDYNGGGGHGICRIVGFTSATVVDIEILTPFKGKHASRDWQEGSWSGAQTYPTAVKLADGRLWWFGDDKEWGSVSDGYESFDETFIGDAGPLIRSIAMGGRNKARWAANGGALFVGCDSRLVNVRASSIDEIMTPSNFNNKSVGKIGSAQKTPIELADDRVLFVETAGDSIYELTWSSEKARYLATDFSKLTTDIFATGIRQMAIQNRPDQRIWVCNENADATCIVFEPGQQVIAHIPISTKDTGAMTDIIESIAILPGSEQERVYMSVKRSVGGGFVRYIEKLAKDSEALPGDICKVVDSHVVFGSGSATISGLDHLEGRMVVAWMDGDSVNDSGTTNQTEFLVSGGEITLPSVPATGGCVGLPYRWRYKSPRLAYGVEGGTPMLKNKSLSSVGLMMADYVRSGIKYGTEFDNDSHPLFSLPTLQNGKTATEVVSGPDADEELHSVSGAIGFDDRLVLEGRSPKPATVNALVMGIETNQ
jgi:hypothetical protein